MSRIVAALSRRVMGRPRLFVAATLIWAYAVTAVVAAATIGVGVLYLDFSRSEFIRITLVVEAVSIVGITAGVAVSWRSMRPLLRWMAGARDAPAPEETLRLALKLPRTMSLRSVYAASPLHLAITDVYIAQQADLPFSGFVAVAIAVQIAIIVVWCLVVFGIETLFRMVVDEAAARIPMDSDPPPAVWRIRARILVPVPIMAAMVAIITGGVAVATGGSGSTQLLATALAAVAAVGVLTPLIKAAIIDPLTRPISDLKAAADRVAAGDLGMRVPVSTGDELGALASAFNRMQIGLQEREALRSRITELLEEVRASRARIVAAAHDTRRKVERDLHDGAQQHLVLLGMKLSLAERQLAQNPDAAREVVAEARADLSRALAQLRDLARGIYPAVLTNDGLAAALTDAASHAAIPTTVRGDGADRHPPEVEAAIYFCCVEALQNAAKHAGPGATATIKLESDGLRVRFEVSDDGRGFEVATAARSSGLQNMQDRIGALGGEVRVESRAGAGTTVAGFVPVADAAGR